MRTQQDIQSAYLRAAYSELVDPATPIAWFGAGVFAARLETALTPEQRKSITAVLDDNASADLPGVAGMNIERPDPANPPAQVLLATDTHADVLRRRVQALWGEQCRVIDLFETSGWIDPGDTADGFARTHPERWRESVGVAQLKLEEEGVVNRDARWILAHAVLAGDGNAHRFDAMETDRFTAQQDSLTIGSVVIVTGSTRIMESRFWTLIIELHHTAISPDGRAAVINWAPKREYPLAPMRAGPALWIPDARSDIVEALYRGDGAKGYTVRFDDGGQMTIIATRERTYADLRGKAELARYEAFLHSLPKGARVLDCATGTGPGAELLAAHGFVVTGADVSDTAIAFASRRYAGVDFVCASASSLPFADNSFDAVLSIETIEHLPAPVEAIAEFVRVCKPDGVLCLTTPDEGGCDSPFHEVELSAADLAAALDAAFGAGGWEGEPIDGAQGWHAMVVRRAAAVQM